MADVCLYHIAVGAREYGIPAVLVASEATRRLRDGDLVSVDGTTGIVSITDVHSPSRTALLHGCAGERDVTRCG